MANYNTSLIYKKFLLRKGYSGRWLSSVSHNEKLKNYAEGYYDFVKKNAEPVQPSTHCYESIDLLMTCCNVNRRELECALNISVRTQRNKMYYHSFSLEEFCAIANYFCAPIDKFFNCDFSLFDIVEQYENMIRRRDASFSFFAEDGSREQDRRYVLDKIKMQCDVGKDKVQLLKNQMRIFDDFLLYRDLKFSITPALNTILFTGRPLSEFDVFDF